MTVAAAVEIGAGVHTEPGQTLVQGKGQSKLASAGLTSAAAASSSSSNGAAAPSFRSSWQAMLASLGAGLDGATGEDAGANETTLASTVSGPAEAARKTSPPASSLGSGKVLLAKQGSALEGDAETGITGPSAAGTKTGISTVQASAAAARQSKANGVDTIPEDVSAADSAGSSNTVRSTDNSASTRQINSSKSSTQAASSDTTATLLASAMTGNMPMAMTAPVNTVPLASAAVELRSKLADGSTELASDSTSNMHGWYAQASDSSGMTSTITKSAGKSTLNPSGTTAFSEKATASGSLAVAPASAKDNNLGGIDASTSGGPKSPAAGELDALPGEKQLRVEDPHSALTQSSPSIPAQSGSQAAAANAAPIAPDEYLRTSAVDDAAMSAESGQSAGALTSGGKSGLARGVQSSVQIATRTTHGTNSVDPLQSGSHPVATQTAGTALDAAALAHDPNGAHGAMNTVHGNAGSATSSAAASTAHETFAALDADTTTGTTTWIHAGAQRAEAGFQDPSLGWVGVRAELGGGGVHAALVPGSADAAQTLGGHLAGLNSYLNEQHTPVATLTMAASADRGSDSGVGQGTQQQAGQNHGQGPNTESQTNISSSLPATAAVASAEISTDTGRREASDPASGLGGRYVSVMA
jgi:hypothetical protein